MMDFVVAISRASDAICKDARKPRLSPIYGCIPLSEEGVVRMEAIPGARCEASSMPG